ncbi:MAG TPA: chaperone modulator CbpM [Arachidicoccus soli]|uniref:MerR family transcriptional regulator n=1 Tax=Arachidicoccus soli TaxID=2341117 RepID=A0A386HPF3_9BACT|nr:chaperone modulator CbpM [Arachidicoccus soli]AYD47164.1 MerR family transcriptional regulator [Arachidicoccus soli]HEU0226381.1 chaperone modulator CbpM [Arachidicoccus soli]
MNNHLIPLQHICTHYQAEVSFIQSLHEYGLIEIISEEETTFISEEQIKEIERMIHLHYDLNINIEGIDAIVHLLQKMENLNTEMVLLKNKLSCYL